MARAVGLLSVLVLLAPAALAQLTVHAFVDKTMMGDAETLLYTVEASGDFRDLGRITAPTTRGLTAVQTSPVQSWNVSILNGRQRQKLTLQWQYRPLGPGTAYVGATTLRLDGQTYTTDPIVSVDIIGNPHSAIFDGSFTQVSGGRYLKCLSWYDNEWGYSHRVCDVLRMMGAMD